MPAITNQKKRKQLVKAFIWNVSICIQDPVQLVSSFQHTISVIAINHKDKPLGILEVVPPQRTDLVVKNISTVARDFISYSFWKAKC